MDQFNNVRVAVFATDGFEESELIEPVRALQDMGARVDVVSLKAGEIQAYRHHDKSLKVPVDRVLDECNPDEYQALVLPGGALNTDATRIEPKVQEFIRAFETSKKPIAAICHAAWLLISAGLVQGRKLASYKDIQDDVRNAGGDWLDQEVVVDKNWVTSRQPSDLPAFNREMIQMISDTSKSQKKPKVA